MKFNYNQFYDYIFASLVFFIPLSTAIPNVFLLIASILFLFRLNKKKNISIIKNRNVQIWLGILVLILLNSLVNTSIFEDLKLLSRLALVFLIPIIGFKVFNINLIKISFIIGVNIAVFISIVSIFNFYLETGSFVFGNTKSVSEILTLERPYLGLLCVLNTLISFQLIKYYSKIFLKVIFLLSSFISISLIVIISARISMISLLVILFIRIFYLDRKNLTKKVLFFTLFIISILGTVYAVFVNKNLSERFFIEETFEKTVKKMEVYEPRIVIWNCAKKIVTSESYNPIVGLQGFNKTSNQLVHCYNSDIKNKSKRNYFLKEKFNTHNQFIDFFVSHGIFLIVLLLMFFVNSLFMNKNRFYNVGIILAFLLFFLVENVLHRQLGCYIFGVFIYMYFNKKDFYKHNIIPNYNV